MLSNLCWAALLWQNFQCFVDLLGNVGAYKQLSSAAKAQIVQSFPHSPKAGDSCMETYIYIYT